MVKSPKKIKLPKCKVCKSEFKPFRPLQQTCSIQCAIEYAKEKDEKKRRKEALAERRELKKRKLDLMSVDEYRAKYVQPIINEIVRLIDHEQPCIATGTYGKMSGGHYIAVGANRTICLNTHNIHIQSYHSNGPKGGDNLKYREGLINIYGQEYADFMNGLQACPPLKLNKTELIEIKNKASELRNTLKSDLIVNNPQTRIELRNYINSELGIYPDEFGVFRG